MMDMIIGLAIIGIVIPLAIFVAMTTKVKNETPPKKFEKFEDMTMIEDETILFPSPPLDVVSQAETRPRQ